MNKRAIVSVYDKTGIADFCSELPDLGYEILSSGGTAKHLKENNIPVTKISDFTGFPEMLDGRVKTLHPKIHGGILADRGKAEHLRQIEKQEMAPIDIVVVNLYPFEETVKKDAPLEEVIENIDIGGPTLIRSAAKNHAHVLVVVDPEDYSKVLEDLRGGEVSAKTKQSLALKAFEHTAQYDSIINTHLRGEFGGEFLSKNLNLTFRKAQVLRYGENPNQDAAFYKDIFQKETCVASAKQLHGKELSYNNIMDTDAAFELVKEFKEPAAAIIKHTNPCGCATRESMSEAYAAALECDPMSAFGSVVALNRECDKATAELMKDNFIEVVICPKFDEGALAVLKEKKSIRLLETGEITSSEDGYAVRKVVGGALVQTRRSPNTTKESLNVVTKRSPNEKEFEDMLFAWKVIEHVKSNAILFVKDKATVGVGAGQMSRIDSCKIAARKAGERSKGAVMASDAFFPFRDGIDAAAEAGITAVIQPGGSKRDQEVIDACNENSIAMAFTGMRVFKH